MPQIDQLADTYFSQIFWMLVFFGLTFVVAGLGLLPKVIGTVDDRNQRITDDLAAASAARAAAEVEQAAWAETEAKQRGEVHALIAAAKHQAATATHDALAAAMDKIEARTTAAEASIANARATALSEFESIAADITCDIAKTVAGLAITADEARGAVHGAFAHG